MLRSMQQVQAKAIIFHIILLNRERTASYVYYSQNKYSQSGLNGVLISILRGTKNVRVRLKLYWMYA